jgi:hypothetical protein
MFEHLISIQDADYAPSVMPNDAQFTPDSTAPPADIVDGKTTTEAWLKDLGFDDDATITNAQQKSAQDAFAAMTIPLDAETQKQALTKVTVPKAVQHLVGMLTAYDWAFVEQAKEIRGYCIAQLLEESKHPDAKIRLRSIEVLGKVTEVALFTERIEIKKAALSDGDLEKEIQARMDKYMDLMKVVEGKANDIPPELIELAPEEADVSTT